MDSLSRRALLTAALAGLSLPGRAGALEQPLVCGIFDVLPWVIRGQALPGIGVDLVALLSRAVPTPIQVEAAPHPRLVMQLRDGLIDMVAFVPMGDIQAAGRVLGTLGHVDMGLITRAGMRADRLADFAGRSIGVMRGAEWEPLLRQLPPVERVLVKDVTQALAMIAGGRIDAAIGSRLATEWHMGQAAMDTSLFGPFFTVERQPIQLYLTNARPYPADLVERLEKAAQEVAASFPDICEPYLRRV